MVNEKRLIYLEDAKEALTGWETDPTDEEIEYTLDNLPRVDAAEVVHGRWVKVDHYPPECSICGDIAPITCDGEAHYMGNYCPNCGASMMDGGNEDV